MALLTRYDTPAFLPDFNGIPGQLDAWHRAVSAWFDEVIANDVAAFGNLPLQYYNAAALDPGGILVEQAITWNAFPKELIRRYGRERALVLADRLWPIESYHAHPPYPDDTTGKLGILYRPQEEYCEWHGLRNSDSGSILRVEALIGYAGYGGPNRNSDPTIGASVNALARLGARVTLRNPVGLYMDHIDLSGWQAPDGKGVSDCVRVVRGLPEMVERMVVEVPAERGFDLGDLTIAGSPLRYGGQIAECITVKLVGVANILPVPVDRAPTGLNARGIIDPFNPRTVDEQTDLTQPIPPGLIEAFLNEGTGDSTATPAAIPAHGALPQLAATAYHAKRKTYGKTRL